MTYWFDSPGDAASGNPTPSGNPSPSGTPFPGSLRFRVEVRGQISITPDSALADRIISALETLRGT